MKVQEELKATIRCLPFDWEIKEWIDPISWEHSARRVIFAKSY
jgi:hypothetical protein